MKSLVSKDSRIEIVANFERMNKKGEYDGHYLGMAKGKTSL